MSLYTDLTQRDLRSHFKEIVDAVQSGRSFFVTRGGERIGKLIPLRSQRRFVPRSEFAVMSRAHLGTSVDAFRTDQETAVDGKLVDPHASTRRPTTTSIGSNP